MGRGASIWAVVFTLALWALPSSAEVLELYRPLAPPPSIPDRPAFEELLFSKGSDFTLNFANSFVVGVVSTALSSPPADDRDALADQPFVLIVEDDPTFASILLDLVHEAGLKGVVSTAGSGTTAMVRKMRPSAITLDLGDGTFFPLTEFPTWAQVIGHFNPLFHCVQLVRHAVFGFEGWADVGHLGFLVVFALVSWRLAIRFMERKLIL